MERKVASEPEQTRRRTPIQDKGDALTMDATRATLLDSLRGTQLAIDQGIKVPGELVVLGVRPHWALAFMEAKKDCENKTVKWPYKEGLRWIGLVASSSPTSLKDERCVAHCAERDPRSERREYTCKNHLIGFLLMGPPTPQSVASKWAIHEEWVKCAKVTDGPHPGWKLKTYHQWAVHRAIRLKQSLPGFDAPLGMPQRIQYQPAAAKKVRALWNKIRRRGESFFTM